jgi:hypothetical protein
MFYDKKLVSYLFVLRTVLISKTKQFFATTGSNQQHKIAAKTDILHKLKQVNDTLEWQFSWF